MFPLLYWGPLVVTAWALLTPEVDGVASLGQLHAALEEAADDRRTARVERTEGVWPIHRQWNDTYEHQFSAWVAHLFRPLPHGAAGWRPLHQVLRRPERNLLHNSLGLGEDETSSGVYVRAVADCGDLPYQLRAYFAWKLGLPFRFQRCTRGSRANGPRCPAAIDNLTTRFDHLAHPVVRFNAFLREGIAWQVHSGTMRTLPGDQDSDFYPIALSRESIRPGTVFVDVAGHALMVTGWDDRGLRAVDGHPDKTVTTKRFTEAHFRYVPQIRTGGFKAFRPVVVRGGRIEAVPNRELHRFTDEQYQYETRQAFYRQMSSLNAGRIESRP